MEISIADDKETQRTTVRPSHRIALVPVSVFARVHTCVHCAYIHHAPAYYPHYSIERNNRTHCCSDITLYWRRTSFKTATGSLNFVQSLLSKRMSTQYGVFQVNTSLRWLKHN